MISRFLFRVVYVVGSEVQQDTTMSHSDELQWEYETLRPPRGETRKEASDPKEQLNELGTDGWELVTTIDYTGGGTKFLVFRRPADATDDG